MSSERLIKKYENRKLYCTTSSAYVTLEKIGSLVREGQNIRVVCNQSQKDITGEVLKAVISTQDVSVADLISLIRK